MTLSKTLTVGLALATASTLAVASTPAAQAQGTAPPRWHRTLSDSVAAPFQIALNHGKVYYSDGFAGTVSRIDRKGDHVVARVKGEIAGVEFSRDGRTMAFASSTQSGTSLTIRRKGRPDVVADLSGYEQRVNPDGKQTYGIIAGGNPCAASFLASATSLPATYTGTKDSHPYQVAALRHGAWAVADAAANAILRVSRTGRVSTAAVLPRQPITFTAAQAQALGAPSCVVGVTYAFEPVPTDVEWAAHGGYWVSTLPGGPEDPSLGARGSVYRVSARGVATKRAGGFLSATNLAVARHQTLYVTELFGGKVTKVTRYGHRSTVVSVERPLSVEARRHSLYVGTLADIDQSNGQVLSPGKIYRFRR